MIEVDLPRDGVEGAADAPDERHSNRQTQPHANIIQDLVAAMGVLSGKDHREGARYKEYCFEGDEHDPREGLRVGHAAQ